MYQVLFFHAKHQVKAVAIEIVEVDPFGELIDCSTSVHLQVFLPLKLAYNLKELIPDTYFYMALYIQFCNRLGITFHDVTFLFKIDHDDGTVKHILSHLNTT